MSGQVDDAIHIRIAYRDPWTDDDARRLIREPMVEEMYRACEEIAARYSTGTVKVSCV